MQCEICGKAGARMRIEMDGVEMLACEQCARLGNPIEEKKNRQQNNPHPKRIFLEKAEALEQLVLVDDFGKIIKRAREQKQLTFEALSRLLGEKESVLRNIESGHLQPTMETAMLLEKKLGIRIIERTQE